MRRMLLPMLLLLAACSAMAPDQAEPSASDEPGPSASMQLPPPLPSPVSAAEVEVALGWPDTNENRAGVYSWDGSRCAGPFCSIGFMHNGYGSGNLEIRVEVVSDGDTPSGATAVTVAGHNGTYQRIDAQQEEWMVDIGGKTITIRFTARPGTSRAELAEAYAIIGSMRAEVPGGFRLFFRLTTDDWDSG